MPNASDVFRSNDVARQEICIALILNVILKHLVKWTFRVFPVKFGLQVVIVIVVVIMCFLNSGRCVKCWTLLGLLSTGGLRSKKSTRFSIFLTSCCCIHHLRSTAYVKSQQVSGKPSLLRKFVLFGENFVTIRWICSVTSCIVFKQTAAFSSLLESFSCYP